MRFCFVAMKGWVRSIGGWWFVCAANHGRTARPLALGLVPFPSRKSPSIAKLASGMLRMCGSFLVASVSHSPNLSPVSHLIVTFRGWEGNASGEHSGK